MLYTNYTKKLFSKKNLFMTVYLTNTASATHSLGRKELKGLNQLQANQK